MTIKQKIRNVMAGLFLVMGLGLTLAPVSVMAATNKGCETDTAIIVCENVNPESGDYRQSGLWSILLIVINIMVTGVGVVALAGIVYGAVLYTSAGGNQEQVKKAMTVFTNVVIGVVAFGGMWALLNFIVPGGVFK